MALQGPGVSIKVCDVDEWMPPQSCLIPKYDTISEKVHEILAMRTHKIQDEKNHGWVSEITRGVLEKMFYDMLESEYIDNYHVGDIKVQTHCISADIWFTYNNSMQDTTMTCCEHVKEGDIAESAFDRAMEGI